MCHGGEGQAAATVEDQTPPGLLGRGGQGSGFDAKTADTSESFQARK